MTAVDPIPHGFIHVPIADPEKSPPEDRPRANGAETAVVSEDAAALAFAAEHRGKFCHDHDSGRWLAWADSHWQPCRTPVAFHEARELVRRLAVTAPSRRPATLGRAAFVGAVERFAAADPAFARHSGDFDRDPWLLATPGGTVDLRTGTLRRADPGDMLTRCTSVTPPAQADCPRWLWIGPQFDRTLGVARRA